VKRVSIRPLVALTLVAALTAFIGVPLPKDARDQPELPAVALEQAVLYRLEVSLAVFYGGLLLITPAFSGLVTGRLPIEISARGARFADEAEQSAELSDTSIRDLRKATDDLQAGLATANLEIRLLKRGSGDNTHPRVGST